MRGLGRVQRERTDAGEYRRTYEIDIGCDLAIPHPLQAINTPLQAKSTYVVCYRVASPPSPRVD